MVVRKLSLALFIAFFVERLIFTFFASQEIITLNVKFSYFLTALFFDLCWIIAILSIASILDLIVQIKFKSFHFFKWFFTFTLLVLVYFLDQYFIKSSTILSNMVLMFRFDELLDLMAFSQNISLFNTSWFIFILAIFGITYWYISKKNKPQIAKWLSFLLILVSFFSLFYFTPDSSKPEKVNFSHSFVRSLLLFKTQKNAKQNVTFNDLKKLDPIFLGQEKLIQTALLEKYFQDRSAISSLFKRTKDGKPPHICVIMVESLSSTLVGKYAQQTGSVMPFLDSLSKKSLYFPNALSTAQRTHHVLPAIMGSLPHAKEHTTFQEEKYPAFKSIQLLLNDYYQSSFYLGIEPNFNQIDRFTTYCKTDFYHPQFKGLKKEENDYIKKQDFWGVPDHLLFREYQKDQKLYKRKNKSKLDFLLTISTHEPYKYPNPEKYVPFVTKQVSKMKSGKMKNRMLNHVKDLASFNYTDHALRQLFSSLSKLPEYQNTIYIITGDHGSSLLYETEMSKYHVPLIFYSPLLKHPKKIDHLFSHLDLLPTLTNFLRVNYCPKIKSSYFALGKEHKLKKSKRAFIFKGDNLMLSDIIYNQNALLSGKLFAYDSKMSLTEINNKKLKLKLEKQAKLMQKCSWFLVEQNNILSKYEKWKIKSYDEVRKFNAPDTKVEYIVLKDKTFKSNTRHNLIDIQLNFDTKKINPNSPLPIYVKISNNKKREIEYYSEMHFAHNVNYKKEKTEIATAHFFIPENVYKNKKEELFLNIFLHNIYKVQLPIKSVKISFN